MSACKMSVESRALGRWRDDVVGDLLHEGAPGGRECYLACFA